MMDIQQRAEQLVAIWRSPRLALHRALEAHDATKAELEAFKRDVSEAVKAAISEATMSGEAAKRGPAVWHILSRFILPEPVDPLLIEARAICSEAMGVDYSNETIETRGALLAVYTALKRGLTAIKGGGDDAEG